MTNLRSGSSSHALVVSAICPIRGQPIPNDRANEVWAHFEAQAETFKRHANDNAQAQIERVQSESAAAIEKVRAESIAQQMAARATSRG